MVCYFHFEIKFLHTSNPSGKGSGGALVFQGGYHPRKTKHVIRVVFQDQAMYAPKSFSCKNVKNGKHLGMFCVMVINFGKKKDGGKLRKKTSKNAYLGSMFMSGKFILGCLLKVLVEDDIQPETQVPPPLRERVH